MKTETCFQFNYLLSGLKQSAGSYTIHWDGQNDAGELLPSGSYIIIFKAGDIITSDKLLLLR
ncbi:MAG TPA: hypothetical protein ENN22_13300 [bacterium]|nr:hypothetical protein [bacterium]